LAKLAAVTRPHTARETKQLQHPYAGKIDAEAKHCFVCLRDG